MSKGEVDLLAVLRSEFPHFPILAQHPIKVGKKTLYLDYYVPLAKMAFEYDGVQHFKFSKFFHGTQEQFARSIVNDALKRQWCEDRGVTLIRINYKQRMDTRTLRGAIQNNLKTRSSH